MPAGAGFGVPWAHRLLPNNIDKARTASRFAAFILLLLVLKRGRHTFRPKPNDPAAALWPSSARATQLAVVDLVVLVEAALGVPGVLPAMDFQALVVRRYWILAIDIAVVVVIDPVQSGTGDWR